MRKLMLVILVFLWLPGICQKVTVKAEDTPLETVFRSIMEQTGKNFIYSPETLEGRTVTVDLQEIELKKALRTIFNGSGIRYKIKGRNILLMKAKEEKKKERKPRIKTVISGSDSLPSMVLDEVLVESRLRAHPVATSEIGAMKISAEDVKHTPAFLGEDDVMKTFQTQPGMIQAAEGMAGVSVHGGEPDENMVMLDNVPLYSSDHCLGLFSAFNVDAIGHIDSYKSSMPARYDGRLSSYLDVRTRNGSSERRNGSFRLGLAAGAFSINGPIGSRTTYSVALRRTWSEALTLPLMGLFRLFGEKVAFGYSFTDLTAKVTHRFSPSTTGFVSIYYGDDWVYGSNHDDEYDYVEGKRDKGSYHLRWGNVVAQMGVKHELTDELSAEFTLAYTRFFSSMKQDWEIEREVDDAPISKMRKRTSNNIGDMIGKCDFTWNPNDDHRIGFGTGYTLHSFLPERSNSQYSVDSSTIASLDSTWRYIANEGNLYIEDEMRVGGKWMLNAGVHASLFSIEGKTHWGISPRLSISYNPGADIALKLAFSRTVQYVSRLSQAYISLPSDQWIPITGGFRPETADKVSAGLYWLIKNGEYSASVEGYMKYMRNLIDYRDEYYLKPPMEMWSSALCSGEGSAKGIDIKLEKRTGTLTGHISYSLAWADRKFAEKNDGRAFPARLDQRHSIYILANWDISRKVRLSTAWTGHSGSRFTLMTQAWTGPEETDGGWWFEQSALKTGLNRYRLPFYHRLDLSCTVKNSRGYWNFGLYNAYCHMNTVGIRRAYDKEGKPVFQKVALLPIIPSASYTWIF